MPPRSERGGFADSLARGLEHRRRACCVRCGAWTGGPGRTCTANLPVQSRTLWLIELRGSGWDSMKIAENAGRSARCAADCSAAPRRESNPLPSEYQSPALPNELRRNSGLTAAKGWWTRRGLHPARPLKRRMLRCQSFGSIGRVVLPAGFPPAASAFVARCSIH